MEGGQVALVRQTDKVLIEAEWLIDLFKVKIVQVLISELEGQFALDLKIEAKSKVDLELLTGQLVDQTVLIIVQVFQLA